MDNPMSAFSQRFVGNQVDRQSNVNMSDKSQMTAQLLLHKIKKTFLGGITKSRDQKGEKSQSVMEECMGKDKGAGTLNGNRNTKCLQLTDNYGTFDLIEHRQCQNLVVQIKHALASVQQNNLHSEILIPCGLVTKIARDIMELSSKEPCGLRGCVLFINLEGKDQCQNLIKFACDPDTVATFELYLTLKEDTRGWCALKKLFISLSGCLEKKPWNTDLKLLCSGYQLEKKKLYRLNS